MNGFGGIAGLITGWRDAQRNFWSAASDTPAFADAGAFAPPDWQAFDGAILQLIDALPEGGEAALTGQAFTAAASYRDVIARAWARIQTEFEAHRRAIHDPSGPPPDWRLLRDRWFAIAEAEFIRTLRGEAFLEAQGAALHALLAIWARLPEAARQSLGQARHAGATARQTLDRIGIGAVEIAATPSEVIWRSGRTSLRRYEPLGGRIPTLGPVVLCHGLIGRQTMTDLRPERSMVRQLLTAGTDVFVIDWGSAGPEDADLSFEHYAGTMLAQCLDQARAASGAERVVLFGICQGGTLAACHAAQAGGGLSGLITAVAPFDFHADIHDADPAHGLVNLWLRAMNRDDVEGLIAMEGNLSGEFLGMIFNQLNPVRTLAKYAIDMFEAAADPAALATFVAMEKWLADRPDLPGALARTWLIDLYQQNALVEGRLTMAGRPVDLGRVTVPVLNIFATDDHIVPPPCSRALRGLLGDVPYQELALPTGHVGAFVAGRAQVLLAPAVTAWLRGIG